MGSTGLFAVFTGLMITGMPIALVILGAAILFVMYEPGLMPLGVVQALVNSTQPFPLITIPLFLLAGELMNASGISRRLMDFATSLTGHMPGGLAQVNVVVSTLKGGMSGSANADAAMDAKMLVPEMTRRGYDPAFSSAITATSAFTAAMLPPSISLLMFGFVTDTSIGALFLAGIVPSILLTLAFMLATHIIAKRRNYGGDTKWLGWGTVGRTFIASLPALLLPLVIAFGIRLGMFTPSEAGAVAVLYALFFCAVTREASWSEVYGAMWTTAATTGAIMLVLAATGALSFVLTFERIPQAVAEQLVAITSEPHLLLMLICVLVFVVGIFIEGLPMILILAPMFLPAVTAAGIDPVHYGVVFVLVSLLGGITPPVGTLMATTCAITKVPMGPFFRECLPFLVAIIVTGLIIIFIPQTATWLAYL